MTSQEGFPTPLEIKVLAEDYGYTERRPEASSTLFFQLDIPAATPEHPTLINIYYTTRGIMTKLHHPSTGRYNELWRVSAYDSLESLAMLFEDPRTHTGKGYRDVKNKPKVRGCVKCGYSKLRNEYNEDMWKSGPHKSICRQCCQGENKDAGVNAKVEGGNTNGTSNGKKKKQQANNNGGSNKNGNANNNSSNNNNNHSIAPTVLSEAALREHNRTTSGGVGGGGGGVERRQFNCPICPTEGRGKHVFFKNVPVNKPICKCPKCKKIKSGDCERLYPIPRGEEKGYGLFRCTNCKSTWGSSRAIGNIGQQCAVCLLAGNPGQYMKPFRMEVPKNKGGGGGIAGGGARPAGRYGARRKPREPIREEEEVDGSYTPLDRARFQNRSGSAPAGGQSFEWVQENITTPRNTSDDTASQAAATLSAYKTANTHQCEGCVTGICRSRKMPISGVHDVHDGDTVSTSGSFVTNSEVDKTEFVDRDFDFDDWDEEDDGTGDVWVTMGKNGKMLRG